MNKEEKVVIHRNGTITIKGALVRNPAIPLKKPFVSVPMTHGGNVIMDIGDKAWKRLASSQNRR